MWPRSARFDPAIASGPSFRTFCTITAPDADPVTVDIAGGTLSVDGSARNRRTIRDLRLVGDKSVYELAATPGALFLATHGVDYRSSDELLPIFAGEVLVPEQDFGDGSIGVQLVDLSNWLARCSFSSPFIAEADAGRVATITAVVEAARPGTSVTNLSTDTSTLAVQQMWTTGPLDVIADLTRDGGTEAFFYPDGSFIIRDMPTTTTPAVYAFNSGAGGTLESIKRRTPLNRLYNRVVVHPGGRDGSQTWANQEAEVTDPTHPRYSGKIGVATLDIYSATAQSDTEALGIARRELDRVLGAVETLSFGAISMPALEANDAVDVVTPQINNDPPQFFRHFIDRFDMNLRTGSMSAASRRQVATDG